MARCKDWGVPHEHAHGTTTGWSYHGCRCAACESKHYEYHRAFDRRRAHQPERMSQKRRYHRTRRLEGRRDYEKEREVGNRYHRDTDWAASRRYREMNRAAINARARQKTASIRASTSAPRKKWWTPEDDQIVLRTDVSDVEIAYLVGRTPGAVAQRRLRLSRGAEPRFFKSDTQCMRGHPRDTHGRKRGRHWVCRECQRQAKVRHRQRILEQAA